MKKHLYRSRDGVLFAYDHPMSSTVFGEHLGSIEVQETGEEKKERDLVVENFNLQNELVRIDNTIDECIREKYSTVPLGRKQSDRLDRIKLLAGCLHLASKKPVVKEAEMIAGYSPGELRFKLPPDIDQATNIKCTYEIKP